MGCTHLGVLCPLELLGAPPSPALYTGYKFPLSQCSGWSRRHPRSIQSQRESRGGFPTRTLAEGGSLVCVPTPFQRPQLERWLGGKWNSFGYFGFFNYSLGLDGFRIEAGNAAWHICGFNT